MRYMDYVGEVTGVTFCTMPHFTAQSQCWQVLSSCWPMQIYVSVSLSCKVKINPIDTSLSSPTSRQLSTAPAHHQTKHRQRRHSKTQHTYLYEPTEQKAKACVKEMKFYSNILAKRKTEGTFSQAPTGHPTLHYTRSWFDIRRFAINLTGQAHPVSPSQVSAAEWWVFLKVKSRAPQGFRTLNPAESILPSQEL